MRDVVVTGAGAVSVAGRTAGEVAAALGAGRLRSCEITAFEPAAGEPTRACEISDFDLAAYAPSIKSYIDRTSALALAATHCALEDAGTLQETARAGGEIGLVYGTQWGCLESMELFYAKLKGGNPRFAPPLPFSHSYANSPASVVAIELKLRGYHMVHSTGRTSGALAIQTGFDAIALGRARAVACCASDALSRPAFSLHMARGLLLPDGAGEPGADDDRVVLGEGGACIVIEDAEAARDRAARVRARILAAGASASEDAAGAIEDAAREALLLGGTAPGAVVACIGTAASGAGRARERRGIAAALEIPEARAEAMLRGVGRVCGETMSASGMLAAIAACDAPTGPTLVACAEGAGEYASASAVLVGPA